MKVPVEAGTHGDGRVDVVLSGDGVRDEEVDNLSGGEAGIAHASEDDVVRVRRLGDEQVGRGQREVRAASKELQARATGAVRDADSASELDAVSGQ